MVVRFYLQELGCLFVASYDWQGYGKDIRPRLHTEYVLKCPPFITSGRIE
jgi:hypothetical protein